MTYRFLLKKLMNHESLQFDDTQNIILIYHISFYSKHSNEHKKHEKIIRFHSSH